MKPGTIQVLNIVQHIEEIAVEVKILIDLLLKADLITLYFNYTACVIFQFDSAIVLIFRPE